MLTARGHRKQRWKRPIGSFSPFPGEDCHMILHSAWSTLAFNYSSKGLSPLQTFSRNQIFAHDPHRLDYIRKVWILELTLQVHTEVLSAHNQTSKPLNPLSLLSVNFKMISLVTTPSVLSYSTFSTSVHITSLLPWVFILAEESLWKNKFLFQRVKEHGL